MDFDPAVARAELGRDPVLGPLVAARPGVRVPGMWAPSEVAVRAAVGASGAGDLAARYGVPVPGLGHGLTHVFPSPVVLAETDEPVAELAKSMAAGAELRALSPDAAQHVALRAGERDAFPAGDPAVRSAVRALAAEPGPLATVALAGRGPPSSESACLAADSPYPAR